MSKRKSKYNIKNNSSVRIFSNIVNTLNNEQVAHVILNVSGNNCGNNKFDFDCGLQICNIDNLVLHKSYINRKFCNVAEYIVRIKESHISKKYIVIICNHIMGKNNGYVSKTICIFSNNEDNLSNIMSTISKFHQEYS